MTKNKSLLMETWCFLMERKVWWLAPIIIMLILVGILIIFGQSSAVSPFIYALFGTSQDIAAFGNITFFVILIFATYGIGKNLFNEKIGVVIKGFLK